MSCGEISVLDGGTIKNATVLNTQMANSLIQASELDSVTLKNVNSLDEVTAQKIADAIAALPFEKLVALINALQIKQIVVPGVPDDPTEMPALPTTMYGSRDSALGEPEVWSRYSEDYVVPLYKRRA